MAATSQHRVVRAAAPPRVVDRVARDHVTEGVAVPRELVDERFRDVLDHGKSADHVSI